VGQTKFRSVLITLIYLTETRVQSGTFKGSTCHFHNSDMFGNRESQFLSRRYP